MGDIWGILSAAPITEYFSLFPNSTRPVDVFLIVAGDGKVATAGKKFRKDFPDYIYIHVLRQTGVTPAAAVSITNHQARILQDHKLPHHVIL